MRADPALAVSLSPFGRTIAAAPALSEVEVGHAGEKLVVGDEGGERRHC